MNTTTTQPMPAPPANPGPRVRCLIAIADTSLSAFEKLRLSEEAITAQPPRANLPYVRALVKYLGQTAVAEADDRCARSMRCSHHRTVAEHDPHQPEPSSTRSG